MSGERGDAPKREVIDIAALRKELVGPKEPVTPPDVEGKFPKRAADPVEGEKVHDLEELRRLAREEAISAEEPKE